MCFWRLPWVELCGCRRSEGCEGSSHHSCRSQARSNAHGWRSRWRCPSRGGRSSRVSRRTKRGCRSHCARSLVQGVNRAEPLKNLSLQKENHRASQKCITATNKTVRPVKAVSTVCQKDVQSAPRLRTGARHFDPGRHLHGVESSKDRKIVERLSLVLMSSPLCRLGLVPPPLRRLELAPSALWRRLRVPSPLWRLGPVPSSPDPALL